MPPICDNDDTIQGLQEDTPSSQRTPWNYNGASIMSIPRIRIGCKVDVKLFSWQVQSSKKIFGCDRQMPLEDEIWMRQIM